MANNRLSPKERAFARAYVKLRQGKAAAIEAGYPARSAEVKASQLIRIVKVRAEIERLEGLIEEKTLITKEKLIDEWARIAFADPADVMSWTESGIDMIPSDKLEATKRRLIKSLSHHTTAVGDSFKVEMVDRDSAKKEIAKLMGYYPAEKFEHTGEVKFRFSCEGDEAELLVETSPAKPK